MDSGLPANTVAIMVLVFAVITFLFAIAIVAFVNPEFRDRVMRFLPFSREGGKNPPISIIILIIVAAMVLAYFF